MRILSLDLARGYTVFIMPAVHVTLIYSSPTVLLSPWGKTLGFFAEETGAPLFMLLMGISLSLKGSTGFLPLLQRAAWLLLLAFLLNLLKFILPAASGWLPAALFQDLGLTPNSTGYLHLLFLGDILHFAALTFVVLALLNRFSKNPVAYVILYFIVLLCSPFIHSPAHNDTIPSMMIQWINGHPPGSFFPLFNWICYPLAGLCTGYVLQHTSQPMQIIRNAGLLLLAGSLIINQYTHQLHLADFYTPASTQVLYYTSTSLLWIYICHLTAKQLNHTLLADLLRFLSRHITLVYFIQWILIFWCLPIFGYHRQHLTEVILTSLFLSLFVFILCYFITLTYPTKKPLTHESVTRL